MNIKFLTTLLLLLSVSFATASTETLNIKSFSIDLVNYTNLNPQNDFKIKLYANCTYSTFPRPWPQFCGEEDQIQFRTISTNSGLRLVTENKLYSYTKGKKKKIRISLCIDHDGASSEAVFRCRPFSLKKYKKALSKLYYFSPKSFPVTILPKVNGLKLSDWVTQNPLQRLSIKLVLLSSRGRETSWDGMVAFSKLNDSNPSDELTVYPYSKGYLLLSDNAISSRGQFRFKFSASVFKYKDNGRGGVSLVKSKVVFSRKFSTDIGEVKTPHSITNLNLRSR